MVSLWGRGVELYLEYGGNPKNEIEPQEKIVFENIFHILPYLRGLYDKNIFWKNNSNSNNYRVQPSAVVE